MTTLDHFCCNIFYGGIVFYCSFSAKVSQDLEKKAISMGPWKKLYNWYLGKNDINKTTISKEAVFPCVDIGG